MTTSMRERFVMDVARWLVPGEIGDPAAVTPKKTLLLLYRNMGLRAMLFLRLGRWFKTLGVPMVPSLMQRIIYRRYALDVVIGADFGGGLYIAHPAGTTLAPAKMGENCSVIAAVTIGMRNERDFPVIGDRVFLGAGARVLGGIELGDDARVGANAVVIEDVAPDTSVVGVPAKPLPTTTSATEPG